MSEVAVKETGQETRGLFARFMPRDERVVLVAIIAGIFAILVLPPLLVMPE